MADRPATAALGTDRFEVLGQLGEGGMGIVYRALDRSRGGEVALKTLKHLDAQKLYRLKQEFRALADVHHPNLVSLHELISADGHWFFTMELVDGESFLEHLRSGVRSRWKSSDLTVPLPVTETESISADDPIGPVAPAGMGLGPGDLDRLRACLRQLAEAVHALHRAGKLHRDLKPSNVLVTPAGRVVVLDFGLATEIQGPADPTERRVLGTAPYMSPEQAANRTLGPASDWYSIGVMLYEVLTGILPFSGSALDVMLDKQRLVAVPPSHIQGGLPADLDALCVRLLRARPEERPAGPEILALLGASAGPRGPVSGAQPALLGRGPHLGALESAFAATQTQTEGALPHAVTVYLHGGSGMGKSALLRSFLDDLERRLGAVVLLGRCYERESVPYKALDSLVDALCQHLLRLPPGDLDALMPQDAAALARVFPVLRRIDAVARARRRGADEPPPQELRRRAFGALRELLLRMSDRRPVVLAIDDLQWGDVDSAKGLADLVRPPDPPSLLLVACYRGEEAQTSPALRTLLERHPPGVEPDVREVRVAPLDAGEAEALAHQLLVSLGLAGAEHARTIAAEAGGNPFFVTELVRYLEAGATLASGGTLTVADVLAARLAHLPPPARRLLEVVAVAGHPLALAVAQRAAELGPEDWSALHALRAAHLVRARTVRDEDGLEPYHDRIRETVAAGLPADARRRWHQRLAVELEVERADPEQLLVHFEAAGDTAGAGRHAARAAALAAEALAFDRAASLYRAALELSGPGSADAAALSERLGDALSGCGRGTEAAHAYLEAARLVETGGNDLRGGGGDTALVLELKRRAADQLLRSGHVDAGVDVLRAVLAAVRMTLPATPTRALASLLLRRARVRLRGLDFVEREASQVPAAELARIDVCWGVSIGLAMNDHIRGADFQARHLLLALSAGEPHRILRALTLEIAYASAAGLRGRKRVERIEARVMGMSERLASPYARALATATSCIGAFQSGQWRRALDQALEAETTFRDHCAGAMWERATVQMFALWSQYYLGELGEQAARVPTLLREALDRGDNYAASDLRMGLSNMAWLTVDDVEGARRAVTEAIGQWSKRGFHLQHYYDLCARSHIDLYAGDGAAAWARMTECWPALDKSLLLGIQNVRLEALHLRASCALSAAASAAKPDALLAAAWRDARRIAREGATAYAPLADLLAGAVLAARGDRATARARFSAAVTGAQACEMALFACLARRRLAEVSEDPADRAQVDAADAWMRTRGIKNPARMAATLAPLARIT